MGKYCHVCYVNTFLAYQFFLSVFQWKKAQIFINSKEKICRWIKMLVNVTIDTQFYAERMTLNRDLKKWNIHLTNSRWFNHDPTKNLHNWAWPKLKPTNLNLMSRVILTSMPDVFFSCRGAKWGWAGVPASASLQAGAGGPVQADRTSIFFGVKFSWIWWGVVLVVVSRVDYTTFILHWNLFD